MRRLVGQAGFAGRPGGGVGLQHAVGPAGMEEHHIPLADLDALCCGRSPDIGRADTLARRHHLDVEIPGHIQQHSAAHQRWYVVDAELFKAADIDEVCRLVTVVIGARLTHMAEAIELWADTEPQLGKVVVINNIPAELGLQGTAVVLARLDDLQLQVARGKGGCSLIDHDAQRVALTLAHQFGRHQHLLGRHVVGGADFVLRTPPGGLALFRADPGNKQQQ